MEGKISMSRKPVVPTSEQMVQDAVANSRLSGYKVTEDVKAVMLRIARGEMSDDQLGACEKQQGTEWSTEGDGK
ncbi:antitoxin VbhA family protein [Ensifer sp. ENS05]|uniref:antitoxin VbhA family protein n=1 Tax=Ensifer sp. ENS05 TaxID=2769277 RepID=UPI00177FA5C0|nr:antitoxin VbhA family protein [Ensifer sp. ENS05]MBD9596123.1 antitoxin VbhA family protein [Ensifer sp. ENS05]